MQSQLSRPTSLLRAGLTLEVDDVPKMAPRRIPHANHSIHTTLDGLQTLLSFLLSAQSQTSPITASRQVVGHWLLARDIFQLPHQVQCRPVPGARLAHSQLGDHQVYYRSLLPDSMTCGSVGPLRSLYQVSSLVVRDLNLIYPWQFKWQYETRTETQTHSFD